MLSVMIITHKAWPTILLNGVVVRDLGFISYPGSKILHPPKPIYSLQFPRSSLI